MTQEQRAVRQAARWKVVQAANGIIRAKGSHYGAPVTLLGMRQLQRAVCVVRRHPDLWKQLKFKAETLERAGFRRA